MADNDKHQGDVIRRFHGARIVEHWLLIITFVSLVCTGLSQRFYYLDVSQWAIMQMGGIDTVRTIHRYAGTAFAVMVAAHVLVLTMGLGLKRWQPTMLITKKDFFDAVHNIKYYVGMENHPARCDRYDYKQKFVYWSVLGGGLLMVATGLTLWFPVAVVRWLPGEAIPTAKALHSNEALLIFLLVALWHIYDSIFSPDVFPVDKTIFTGRISRDRMLNEHPVELSRMEGVPLEELLEKRREDAHAGNPGAVSC
jgi:cytochrome b subunit of formate dehydrogenase